jgi:parallel beta-helix repeat protein
MNKTACLLLIAILTVTPLVGLSKANFFPPPASLPHVYIRSDGSIEPASVPVQRTENVYTFNGDLANYTLEIQRSNIVVDGEGHFLEGNGSGQGIVLRRVNGVVVRNLALRNLRDGIDVASSSNCTLTGMTITRTELGIYLYNSSYNVIGKSNVSGNSGDAIVLFDCCNYNSITENQITEDGNGGINLQAPNTLLNQTACDYNSIVGNNLTANVAYGIWVLSSSNCLIQRNTIANTEWGMQLHGSTCKNNTVIWNKITGCHSYGIILAGGTSEGTIAKNALMCNSVGVDIFVSENNQFYNNNFVNNYKQVDNHFVEASNLTGTLSYPPSQNSWDNGSSSGGNYWSDLNRKDDNNDGYSEDPYIVDANNTDHYPLMQTFSIIEGYTAPSPSPSVSLSPSASENQSEPPFNLHSTIAFPIEVAYTLAGVLAIVAVGAAVVLRKRKTSKHEGLG